MTFFATAQSHHRIKVVPHLGLCDFSGLMAFVIRRTHLGGYRIAEVRYHGRHETDPRFHDYRGPTDGIGRIARASA